MDNSTTFHIKARAMLCTSLTVLLAACGGGSGTDAAKTDTQTSAQTNAETELLARRYSQWRENNPAWRGNYATWIADNTTTAPTKAAPTTAVPTTTAPTTTAPTTTAPTTTAPTTTAPTTTAPTTTAPTTYNYYVATTGSDSNPGTQAAPFRTIQHAANVVKPDTTVHVAPGTYAETISSSISGTASARIRYVSDTKWGAKIVPVAGARSMWQVTGGYTDIVGFEIDGTNSTSIRIGIALKGGNSSIQNSSAHHVAQNSGCDSQGGAALHSSQSRGPTFNNYDFIGNVVHHIGGGCGWIQGIYHQSSGNIKNNIVYASSVGINLFHDAHDTKVVNNTVFGNSVRGINYGGCEEAYNNGCPTSGIRVHNNIVYDNRTGIAGPYLAIDVDNEVKNNIVFGNTTQYDLASPSSSSRSGEINADPQFVNYIRGGGGDYRLKSTSPAIDKGSSTYAPSTDINGTARSRGAAVDIGSYEY